MPAPTYEPLDSRAKWVVRTLVVVAVVDLLAIASGVAEHRLLTRVEAGELVTDSEIDASDNRQAAVGIAQFALFLVAAFFFIRWFNRAYENLVALGAGGLRYSAGWAIGAWFVPVLNLWRPKQIANDVWRASSPGYPPGGRGWRDGPVPVLFQAWWALFLIANWVSQGALRYTVRADEISEFKAANVLYLVSDGTDLAAAGLAVAVVLRTTRRQEERARRLASLPAAEG